MRFRAGLLLVLLWAVAGPVAGAVYKVHVVQRGDTLSAIARQHGYTVDTLARSNRIDPGATLKVGQRIYLPIRSRANPVPDEPAASTNAPPRVVPLGVPVTRPIPRTTAVPKAQTVAPRTEPLPDLSGEADEDQPPPRPKPVVVVRTLANKVAEVPGALGRMFGGSAYTKAVVERAAAKRPGDFRFVGRVKREIDAPLYKARVWRNVVVHHSGSRGGSAAVFNAYHRRRGMSNGLAYHFVIGNGTDSGDGEIEVGSRWTQQIHGGHVHSDALNKVSIGICLVGNFNETRPTARQIASTIELIDYLRYLQGRSNPIKFYVHREINPRPTECPGAKFPSAALHRRLN